MTGRVLVVDDDVSLARTFADLLREAGYTPLLAHTAEDGLKLALVERPQLALLDIMVPHMGGWSLCQKLRALSDMPIIFLTALGDVEHIVKGLEMGADDYLVKPVAPAEFIARVNVRLRRQSKPANISAELRLGQGEVIVNLETRQIVRDDLEIELTPREFELFSVFVAHIDQVMTTADLAAQAWGMDDASGLDNVKPYIHYLRKKLEKDPASPRWIQTVRGVGYRLTSG